MRRFSFGPLSPSRLPLYQIVTALCGLSWLTVTIFFFNNISFEHGSALKWIDVRPPPLFLARIVSVEMSPEHRMPSLSELLHHNLRCRVPLHQRLVNQASGPLFFITRVVGERSNTYCVLAACVFAPVLPPIYVVARGLEDGLALQLRWRHARPDKSLVAHSGSSYSSASLKASTVSCESHDFT